MVSPGTPIRCRRLRRPVRQHHRVRPALGVRARGDCDDTRPWVQFGRDRVRDPMDNDCDGYVDDDDDSLVSTEFFYADTDGDTYGDSRCLSTRASCRRACHQRLRLRRHADVNISRASTTTTRTGTASARVPRTALVCWLGTRSSCPVTVGRPTPPSPDAPEIATTRTTTAMGRRRRPARHLGHVRRRGRDQWATIRHHQSCTRAGYVKDGGSRT